MKQVTLMSHYKGKACLLWARIQEFLDSYDYYFYQVVKTISKNKRDSNENLEHS